MGSVYLAVQESLRRPVALKVLAPKLAADRDSCTASRPGARRGALCTRRRGLRRRRGEQRALPLDGVHGGGSLEQKLAASGPLPWKPVLSVLGDAAAGLAYAESRGIVHRDIKPANLMYSGTGTVKIADLGLATTLEQEAIEADQTPSGGRKVYGTPHFIAPEQARGEAVDHRSDLYSLGATAYRLLSGKTPFEGGSTREILRALQTEAPRPLHELVPDLPPDLEGVVARLMEKDPAARFPTAETLRRECERLRLVAEHGPTLEVQRGSRAQRWVGVTLLLVVGGATAAWYRFARQAPVAAPSDGASDVAGRTNAPPSDDPSFISGTGDAGPATDEEGALRAREHEASRALGELPDYLTGDDRVAALERIETQYAGTSAADTAASQLAALRASAPPDPAPAEALTANALENQLRGELDALEKGGGALVDELRAIDAFTAPPALAAEFEPRRARIGEGCIQAAEEGVKAKFAQATQLALEGKFDELRTFLAGLEPLFADLDAAPGDPARLGAVRALKDELAARRGRVDEEERFYHANAERALDRASGEALGPGSGLLAELAALDLGALETRLTALAPELRARAFPTTLARGRCSPGRPWTPASGVRERRMAAQVPLRSAHEEGCAGARVRADGALARQDGDLESLPWRESTAIPSGGLLFSAPARDWKPEEERARSRRFCAWVETTRGAGSRARCSTRARAAACSRLSSRPSARSSIRPSPGPTPPTPICAARSSSNRPRPSAWRARSRPRRRRSGRAPRPTSSSC
jgi:hypothetical protein